MDKTITLKLTLTQTRTLTITHLDIIDLDGVLTRRQEQRAGLVSIEAVAPCARFAECRDSARMAVSCMFMTYTAHGDTCIVLTPQACSHDGRGDEGPQPLRDRG